MESVVLPAIREKRDAANAKMVARFASTHTLTSFPVGSFVMAKDETRVGKLSPYYEGPFKVARRNRGGAYLLLDHDGVLLGRNYAPAQLVAVPSPTKEVPLDNVHVVEHILNHKKCGHGYKYLVKWKGFDPTHNTWEPSSNFFDISVIAAYWKNRING